jgi:hypothetical protein
MPTKKIPAVTKAPAKPKKPTVKPSVSKPKLKKTATESVAVDPVVEALPVEIMTEVVIDPLASAFDEEPVPAPAKVGGFEIPADVAASILAAGEALGAAKTAAKAPTARSRITDAAWRAAEAGELPPALNIPTSNAWMQAKADALRDMAKARDAAGLAAYEVGGTNTYSKALRSYRDACLAYVTTAEAIADLEEAA